MSYVYTILYISVYSVYVDCTSVCPREQFSSSAALLQDSSFSLKGFLRSLIIQFEGLRTEGVKTVQLIKPSKANNICDFGLNKPDLTDP